MQLLSRLVNGGSGEPEAISLSLSKAAPSAIASVMFKA